MLKFISRFWSKGIIISIPHFLSSPRYLSGLLDGIEFYCDIFLLILQHVNIIMNLN